ncbi:MAG: Nitrogen regulatory protein P-II [Spirochaetes bacterium ADurb.Bin218]|jgi:nitrogen regulatory protein P-II 1|nr:P-II family nitrogen regulator [Spirochaetota bacterium]OQA98010.1 MAG: Nitrogen regulatory protein P-II [Spirochaetes bacterium ADurb.Bin218]HOQ11709.1 P-II family nitrogen regulator [Spirochaetota bacterium]HOV07530.1 P-II family nitrogen regulator [Spirochaetota bacterium]HPX90525.1 P-II family nitrogen regulator [Spirochaetota bacterium]
MKYIVAIIRPHKLEDVKKELLKEEVHLMTITEVLGCGRQQGITEVYRGVKEVDNLLRKVKLEIAVNDSFVERTVDAIMRSSREGEIGDGKIFILDLEECIRIRTGERGGEAIG